MEVILEPSLIRQINISLPVGENQMFSAIRLILPHTGNLVFIRVVNRDLTISLINC